MREALLVNPANIDGVADSLHRALLMEEPERRSRMVALRRREQKHNVHAWVDSFLDAAERSRSKLHPASDPEFESWLGAFISARRLALFLDYDGTLTPLRRHPSEAVLSPEMREALAACAARGDTDVTIVTGRALEDIHEMVDMPGLAFAGNHGLEISGGGLEPFRHEDLVHYRDRLSELSSALGDTCRGGAWVEEKGASLTLHFREVDLAQHERIASEARELIQAAGFQARDAHCAVEARPPIGWDKGHAVLHVLRLRYGPAWSANVRAIYAGDDHTDEDAFRVLSGLGVTFRVGGAEYPTAASRTLADVSAVQALVRWLAKRPSAGSPT
jgi:trehalose-phosphatase